MVIEAKLPPPPPLNLNGEELASMVALDQYLM